MQHAGVINDSLYMLIAAIAGTQIPGKLHPLSKLHKLGREAWSPVFPLCLHIPEPSLLHIFPLIAYEHIFQGRPFYAQTLPTIVQSSKLLTSPPHPQKLDTWRRWASAVSTFRCFLLLYCSIQSSWYHNLQFLQYLCLSNTGLYRKLQCKFAP